MSDPFGGLEPIPQRLDLDLVFGEEGLASQIWFVQYDLGGVQIRNNHVMDQPSVQDGINGTFCVEENCVYGFSQFETISNILRETGKLEFSG